MTGPLNIVFDGFGIWLLGYRYILHGHYFISSLWLWRTDEYVNFWFCAKFHL